MAALFLYADLFGVQQSHGLFTNPKILACVHLSPEDRKEIPVHL